MFRTTAGDAAARFSSLAKGPFSETLEPCKVSLNPADYFLCLGAINL